MAAESGRDRLKPSLLITPQDDSDIDFLIDVGEGQNLIDFIRLKQELEDLLGHEVDLAASASLREGMRERILNEAIPIVNL